MTRETFQEKYGQQMGQILQLPAFTQGMILLGIEVMHRIKQLDDSQIRNDSVIILSEIRGMLRHEEALLQLPIISEPTPTSATEEYVDAEEEAWKLSQEQFNRNHRQ